MSYTSRKQVHNHQAILRWLTRYPDRFTYGSPDPTTNMEALPKPTSRVLISSRGYKILEEDEQDFYRTDLLLERALYKLHEQRWPLWMALAETLTGDSAETGLLDEWVASGDPLGMIKAQRVHDAVQFLEDDTQDFWLKVPYDNDDIELRRASYQERKRARRILAKRIWSDRAEQYEKEGMRPNRASGAAARKTAEDMKYSLKEIYRIIKEVD